MKLTRRDNNGEIVALVKAAPILVSSNSGSNWDSLTELTPCLPAHPREVKYPDIKILKGEQCIRGPREFAWWEKFQKKKEVVVQKYKVDTKTADYICKQLENQEKDRLREVKIEKIKKNQESVKRVFLCHSRPWQTLTGMIVVHNNEVILKRFVHTSDSYKLASMVLDVIDKNEFFVLYSHYNDSIFKNILPNVITMRPHQGESCRKFWSKTEEFATNELAIIAKEDETRRREEREKRREIEDKIKEQCRKEIQDKYDNAINATVNIGMNNNKYAMYCFDFIMKNERADLVFKGSVLNLILNLNELEFQRYLISLWNQTRGDDVDIERLINARKPRST